MENWGVLKAKGFFECWKRLSPFHKGSCIWRGFQLSGLFEYALWGVTASPFLEFTENIKNSVDDVRDLARFADSLQEE